ncbi:MAG: hypothetical protein ACOYJG_11615 [Prevotella sp.]
MNKTLTLAKMYIKPTCSMIQPCCDDVLGVATVSTTEGNVHQTVHGCEDELSKESTWTFDTGEDEENSDGSFF